MAQEIDPAALPPGTRIHAYEVVSRLGQGGMGAVYKVSRDGKSYALKIATLADADSAPDARAYVDGRTRREIATLAAISHPNVVQIRAFDRWPDSETGHLYLVTDLVEGDRLYVWQRKHTPSLRHICGVFLHIADALHELHRHEVFHRDLKSENVLVRNDGEPILIDFGIARQRSAHTLTAVGSIVGTSTHLSAAFCRFVTTFKGNKGERYTYGPTDDLHAVGFMLYEVLTGKPPFELVDDDEWTLLLDIANKLPPRPRELNPDLPEVIEQLVLRLLAKEPEQRFRDAQELGQALTAALETATEAWDKPFTPPSLRKRPAFDARGRSKDKPSEGPVMPLLFNEGVPAHPAAPPTTPARPAPRSIPRVPAPPPPEAAATFRPPTEVKRPFQSPGDAVRSAEAAAADALAGIPSEVRIAGAQLLAAERRDRNRAVLLPVAAMGLLCALAVAWVTLHAPARPVSLLTQYEKGESQVAPSHPEPAPPFRASLPPPEQLPPTAPPVTPVATPATSTLAPSPSAPAVQRAVAAPRSAAHPVKAAAATARAPAAEPSEHQTPATPPVSDPATWIKTAQSIDDPKPAATQPEKLGVPFGAHIRVKLRSTLDSRSLSDALVEAILTRPFLLRGEPIIPSRTMVYGAAQTSGDRFILRFSKLRLPDDREVPVSAVAVDTDGKPGLAPTRRITSTPTPSDDVAGNALRASANLVLGKVGGNLPADAAAAAGRAVLDHQAGGSAANESALLLDPGNEFDLVVKEAF